VALNEYDVSIDEIEAPAVGSPEPLLAPEEPTLPEPESPVRAAHIEGSVLEDAPPAVTDLRPPMDGEGEIEELQEIQEIEEEAPPPVPEAEPVPEEISAPAEAAAPPPALDAAALQAVLREQFAARADEIFRAVATEAVEKAMWEMMDRLTAEFSERLRESVEAVAWEVIPATTEALIRDEIVRIRSQAGKPSP